MPEHPIQPPLEEFGERPFSFYPPVLNVEHNEWRFVKSTWSELLVKNTASDLEIWIPRTFIGDLSRVDEPVMIVGLQKELEYRAGSVLPTQRRVIEMLRGTREPAHPQGTEHEPVPSAPRGVHFEGGTESRMGMLIVGALVIGLLLCVAVIVILRGGSGGNVIFSGLMQTELGLTDKDDYFDIVRKLGQPAADRWKSDTGEMQYRLMDYPDKKISVILMGLDRDKARYVGSLDKNWKVVHSVRLPGGGDTRSMLAKLPKF